LEQSPLDLPPAASLDLAKYNAKFNYITLNPEDMIAFYETNLFKIRALNGKIFGSITDSDG